MKRLEVRCCCQPQKLRGWLDVPDGMAIDGRSLRLPLMIHSSGSHGRKFQTLELQVATFEAFGDAYLAIKSEDVPIEMLRRIRGFKEALENWPYA